ncbi:uncharacterized protein CC84DRAFT_1161125 [Paraphaeosphaeria sporulosa]|uniref:Uncharacterized protein n=1 Tax=Paraphaeosphaeria sporulosa TaxID=1460663 RepID=A0A177CRG9_9PLEO|nr:uncharacterized protein CC84DRAFT_1161125 [Paraphaeosphaeria sporulosa]OAG10124.1 hypothetical protein CC84DRAFT_1161125 [Paraphaeosphaeria sporulosa]
MRAVSLLTGTLCLLRATSAEVAPEVTVVEEGYNYIAKLPCAGCPFLFQDTSEGLNEPWSERVDDNALLLNISLPYDSAFLAINNAPLYSGNRILPLVYANQVVQDFSADQLSTALDAGQLEASHESNLGGGFFGLSYRHSLRHVETSQTLEALLFQFDIVELHSDLTNPALRFNLDDPAQKMLEVLLIQRPVLSAGDPSPSFEILSAKLVPRMSLSYERTMHFLTWDTHGEKGTTSHAVSYGTSSLIGFLSSSFWALLGFVMAVIVVSIVVLLMCIFGWEFWKDDYEKAQHGKRRKSSVKSVRADVETGASIGKMKGRFKSAEELGLGLASRGQIVGMGKSD